MQTSVPEAMVLIDSNDNCISGCPNLNKYSVAGVGLGIGHLRTKKLFQI